MMPFKFPAIEESITKEDLQSNTREAASTITRCLENHHDSNIDWKKQAFVIAAVMYLGIIISMTTVIFMMHGAVNELSDNLNVLIDATEQQKTEYNELHKSLIEIRNAINEAQTNTIPEPTETIEPIIDPTPAVTYNTTELRQASGLTAEQFDNVIDETFRKMNKRQSKIAGIGDALYQIEQEYNVNGLYILGIASLESGWGTSTYARKYNNIYGLINQRFTSTSECTVYMGKTIRENYIDKGYDTIEKVQTKYCPNGGSKWVSDVIWCTNKYISTAKDLYIKS